MSILKKSSSVLGTRILLIALAFLSSIVVTRSLGPKNRGVLELLNTLPSLLVNIGHFGIGNANLYFIGKKLYSFEKIFSNTLGYVTLISSLLIAVAVVTFGWFRDTLYAGIPSRLMAISLLVIPLLLFEKFVLYSFLGQDKVYLRNKFVIFKGVANFLLVVPLVVFLRLEIYGVLLAFVVSNVMSTVVIWVMVHRETPVSFECDLALLRKSISFGLVPFLALVVMNLIYKSDVFLIKYFLSEADLGYYGLGVALSEKVWMIPESIGLVVLATAAQEYKENVARTALICRTTLFLAVTLCLLLYVMVPYLLPLLYSHDFEKAIVPFQVLLPGIAFISVFMVLHGDLTGRGRALPTVYIFAFFLLVNIGLNILWLPRMGIVGAALASSLSYSGGSLVLAAYYARMYSIPIRQLLLISPDEFRQYILRRLRLA